ncbi:MAG: dehydrogenase [Bacteroidetes bacterium]|nr:dehydrogenase [Bacteroidota bacterium]
MQYDVIIIGTGAGGATLARKLAPSGKKILLLERGDFLPRERDNWSTQAVFLDQKYTADEHWLDKFGKTFQPGIHYFVGGNTKLYGAALLRMRERNFEEVKHADGISPAWPISYAELEPYYTEAEKWCHVHGQRGSDPTEPWASTPYPQPPLPHEPRIQELNDELKALGLHPFPLPMGVNTNEDPGGSPVQLDRFDGFPDPTEAKADAHVVGVKEALRYPNVTLLTGAFVESLRVNEAGNEVKMLRVQHEGELKFFGANIIVVAAGAINSAALLLRSVSDRHPHGLANGSGQVGRNYMCHNNSALLAVSSKPNPTKFGKTLAINDFYWGSEDFEYPMGHIQMLGKSDALMFRGDAPSIAPGFTLEYMAAHSLDFWLTSEDLPNPDNRVTLERDGTIRLSYTQNNLKAHHQLTKKLHWILENLHGEHHVLPNNLYLGKKIDISGTAHQNGTLRFGTDKKTSVLNTFCRTHEVQNLYVVDGSFFPSSSAVNPSLTIMANALRVGDYLLREVLK